MLAVEPLQVHSEHVFNFSFCHGPFWVEFKLTFALVLIVDRRLDVESGQVETSVVELAELEIDQVNFRIVFVIQHHIGLVCIVVTENFIVSSSL